MAYLLIDYNEETGGPCLHIGCESMAEQAALMRLRGKEQMTEWPHDFDYWPLEGFLIIEIGDIYKGEG